jgi:glycosyltransferase involved in cell wall biosynthesis
LYDNPTVQEQLGQWLVDWRPDIVHVTSCYTLSASVIQAARDQGLPVVLTLTDYWFICPRLSLLRSDGTLCDGRTTSWDCRKCLLQDNRTFHTLSPLLPEKVAAATSSWVSQRPYVNRMRGLRGLALDMEQRKSYLASMIEAANCVIAPSAHLRDVFQSSGISRPIRVIRSGHDLAWLEGLPHKEAAEGTCIGYIGQIAPSKGLHILVSAFVSRPWEKPARLCIFGDSAKSPEYMRELEAIAAEQRGAIQFRGPFPHEKLGEVLSEIDVLVVPSQWHENNPRVIQEAFASKTPVIASNVGGISEFVEHEVNGLLFERDCVDDLAEQLGRVIHEPGWLEQLRAGIPRVKRMEDEVQELLEVYRSLLSPKSLPGEASTGSM